MLPVAAAEAKILNLVQPLQAPQDVERVEIGSAVGRVLAAPISSPLDFPHWDNSAMDGFAVRHADVADCSAEQPAILQVVEEIPAGKVPQQTVRPGEAARILTGAMMPTGADTVVMQEVTQREGDRLQIFSAPQPQNFVRHRGDYHRAGDVLLTPGIVLTPSEIAVLAAAQTAEVPVYRRVRVAVLSTGDELVPPGQPLQLGQIVDSNQSAICAAIAQIGAIPIPLGCVADTPEALHQAITHARTQADVVISSGGVSVGDYDYVEEILQALGGTLHIRAVAIKPGKPLTVATFAPPNATLYFGLPGNPVSALVTFWRFVQPALRKLAGQAGGYHPAWVWGRSPQTLRTDGKRETYLWGRLTSTAQGFEFALAGGSHSSGNLINLAQTNALAMIPVGQLQIATGEAIAILPISPLTRD